MQTLIHAIPAGVFSNSYHGSYKDTISRVRFFEQNVPDYRQVLVEEDQPETFWQQVGEVESPGFVIEYSTLSRIVKSARERFPKAQIAVRSHNLEALQHFDNHGWFPKKGPVWMLYAMGRLFAKDLTAKRNANAIWSISDWEQRVYWNRIPGKAKSCWLPYFCPDHLVTHAGDENSERRTIACLPTSKKNRKSWDLVTRFIRLAEHLTASPDCDYEFVVTGNLADWELPDSSAVSYLGMVDDLTALLAKTRAIAMLSPLGYGFKTTIGDAVANGASVIIHPGLGKRCPSVMDECFIYVDTDRMTLAGEIVERLGQNRVLRSIHHEAKDEATRMLRDFVSSAAR